ncbi:MAG: DUF308 domain-containing protein [Arenicellales bacterium]|nr:DUF308 domain-containing protein [Arenicellales bacterium]
MTLDRDQLQVAAASAKHYVSDRLGDVWWAFLVRGILAAGLGIVALFWPKATLVLLIRLVGIFVLFDGVVGLVGALRARNIGSYLVPGLVTVAVGVILLFWPDVTGRWLLIILGVWALFQGTVLFLAGRQADPNDPDRGLTIAMGSVVAVIGLILVIWPGTGVVTISWIIAIVALLVGAFFIFLAMRLRGIEHRVQKLGR